MFADKRSRRRGSKTLANRSLSTIFHSRPYLERLEERSVPTVNILNNGGAGYAGLDFAHSTGFVPPGGTIKQGPKVPDAQTPAIGAFTLPKKEFILPPPPPPGFVGPLFTNAKAVPGPGVEMTIQLLDPNDPSNITACGGQPCDGPIVNFSDFSGYNDPKHPALFTVSFFGDVFGTDTHLYIIVNGVGTPAPICTKVGGVVSNFPCIKGKDKLNKKTGQWTDVVEMLSQDSGMSRRR